MSTDGPLVSRHGLLCGLWSCLLTAVGFATSLAVNRADPDLGGLFNDFADYWAAARILDLGGDPYDKRLLGQVLHQAGLHTTIGTGYSYPLLLAEVLRPLGLLPAPLAAALFTAGSLACFGLAVALLLSPPRSASRLQAAALATAAGTFLPAGGSLYVGQVNLYVLPLLALAFRGVAGPGALALSAAVKLFPAAAALAFLRLGRRGLRPLLLTGAATLCLALGPNLVTGRWSYGGSVVAMFGRDPYWSNQSLNGWLSRLLPPDVPVTPLMIALAAALGALAVAVAARQRHSWPGAFAVLLCYAVVATPKNSLWNYTPLLVVIVFTWTLVRDRRAAVAVLAAGLALIDAPAGFPAAWLASLPLYGGLLLGGLLAWALLRAPGGAPDDVAHGRAGPGHSRR
jgi:Glycosyltransferase family 87